MTLPDQEEPAGSVAYGSLEDFSGQTGADFIIALVNQITAAATGYTNLQDALEQIASQIGFPQFADLLLSAFEGITGSLLDFLPWFINLTDLLGFDLNIDPANFNPIELGIQFIKHLLSLIADPAGLKNIPIFGPLIDTIFGSLTGGGTTTDPLTDLVSAFTHIPFLNILGIGGPANIGATQQATWDQWIGGLVGTVGSGTGLADLFNIGQTISSKASLGGFSWDILGIRNNKSINTGFLPTSESNFGLDKVALAGSAPTFAVTQSTAIMGFQRISESGTKGVVSWLGSGITNITSAFVNIYKMNTTTGDLSLAHASADVVGSLSGSMQHNVYSLPTPITVAPGEVYGIEIAVRGAGTHSVVGASTWLPDHPSVYPRRMSALRNSGTSSAPLTLTPAYTTNVPFMEFGVTAGDVSIPHSPETNLLNTRGASSLPIPSWANTVQVVAVGAGGGGHQGGTYGISGEGGSAGSWSTATWTRGTDFTGSPSISVTVGTGGIGGGKSGSSGGNGNNGTFSSAVISGHSVTANGGGGGDQFTALATNQAGNSPGNQAYDSVTYVGGPTQSTPGANGAQPGSGGAGGNYISFQSGGNGGDGSVWIRFKQ